jgi:hypothetical protein
LDASNRQLGKTPDAMAAAAEALAEPAIRGYRWVRVGGDALIRFAQAREGVWHGRLTSAMLTRLCIGSRPGRLGHRHRLLLG